MLVLPPSAGTLAQSECVEQWNDQYKRIFHSSGTFLFIEEHSQPLSTSRLQQSAELLQVLKQKPPGAGRGLVSV
jgi:hypothetical protein